MHQVAQVYWIVNKTNNQMTTMDILIGNITILTNNYHKLIAQLTAILCKAKVRTKNNIGVKNLNSSKWYEFNSQLESMSRHVKL